MSERTVIENADETFNLLSMCFDSGLNDFVLQELVKRHLNTIIGGSHSEPLRDAVKRGSSYRNLANKLCNELAHQKSNNDAAWKEIDILRAKLDTKPA